MASPPPQPGAASGQSSPGITMIKPRRSPLDFCLPGDEAWAARVIKLQGSCLQPCIDTPVWRQSPDHNEKFVTSLQTKLRWLLTDQKINVSKYGNFVAREWAVGKIPREFVARFSKHDLEVFDRSDSDTEYSDTEYSDHEPQSRRSTPITRWNRKSKERKREQEERDAARIIETQGAHLPTRPSTPVRLQLQHRPSRSFAYRLTTALRGLEITLEERQAVYGEQEALAWRVGHTPPSVAALRGYSVEEKDYYGSASTAGTPDTLEESERLVPDDGGHALQESPAAPDHDESTTRPSTVSTMLHSSSSPPSDVDEKQRGAARLPMTPMPSASPDSDTDLYKKRCLKDSNAADEGTTPDSETGRPRKLRVVDAKQIPSASL